MVVVGRAGPVFQGARRFTEITAVTGMASRLLTSRLKALGDDAVVVRLAYSMHPPRFEYRLTNMGEELLPVILQMDRWEQTWTRPDQTSSFTHRTCGATLRAQVRCRACGRRAGARDIELKLSRAQLRKAISGQGRPAPPIDRQQRGPDARASDAGTEPRCIRRQVGYRSPALRLLPHPTLQRTSGRHRHIVQHPVRSSGTAGRGWIAGQGSGSPASGPATG